MTNHGGRFDWCTNELDGCEVQRLEHTGAVEYYNATGSIDDFGATIGVSLYFSEDISPAPTLTIGIDGSKSGDAEVNLRLDEAIVLQDALAREIRKAIEGMALNPVRVLEEFAQSSGGERP
jgi:hypothetical protein